MRVLYSSNSQWFSLVRISHFIDIIVDLGCAVFNNMIYAVGGRDDATELSSAERYNPATNTWSPIVAMMSRRSGVGLAVVNGQLYAVGGFDGTTYLKTIEVFDQVISVYSRLIYLTLSHRCGD